MTERQSLGLFIIRWIYLHSYLVQIGAAKSRLVTKVKLRQSYNYQHQRANILYKMRLSVQIKILAGQLKLRYFANSPVISKGNLFDFNFQIWIWKKSYTFILLERGYKISTISYTKAVIRLSSEMMWTMVYNVQRLYFIST